MNALQKIKNIFQNLESRYETRVVRRMYPNLDEIFAEAKREYAAGRYTSLEELETELQLKENYAHEGRGANVPRSIFRRGKERNQTI